MVNMRSKSLRKFVMVSALVLIGFIVLYAFPVEADKSRVEFEASLTVPAGTYQYRATSVYVPPSPESVQSVASFEVLNGGAVKFYTFISSGMWELWQEGKYQPSQLIEGSHGDLWSSGTSQTGEYIDFYLVVQNDGSSSQDVKVWLSRTWHESNKLGLVSGSALVSLGIGVIPLLIFGKSRLHLKYSAIIFTMAFIMVFFLAWAQFWSTPPDPVFNVTQALPGVLFFEAFPLIALLYLLEKNNGFAYFKSWNTKRQLRISGTLLFVGYTFPIFFMLLGMFNFLLRPMPLDPNKLTAYSVIAGGSLMLAGLVIFIGLWASNYRRKSLSLIPDVAKHQ